ncbi:hypothetical protein HMPREF1556_01579 [Porphyromonas sp. oral taxon 278 str. W7784]|nr:hypothetical protein HMPREF1556_01579 [Porphyromonas sp. oral taxon 278 str. W7784]
MLRRARRRQYLGIGIFDLFTLKAGEYTYLCAGEGSALRP